ncbi:DegT/DnrJ/EryC1/StrS family aminotransferase [Roseibium marinum]|uniref:dTDP-4-amino-4,6-dideoxygalactose transaminase n=1 Tax=Roseibium marinum TaxID=281252 RepID=A0A2S3V263_9HYPH|nr:DegT/DnrJ/EryC1/StrS family aminotransferase [Roseibium marinum]POF33873.1 hypothetical protein CLV41_101322 [Roseibium marinum]
MSEPLIEEIEIADLAEDAGIIPLSDPDMTVADLSAVDTVLRSPWISNGTAVDAFEDAFAAYLGRKYAIAFPSGVFGLLLALEALGIGPGDEVIASSLSFRETAHAISVRGARPVFADIDYWSGTIAVAKVEARLTEKTRAIVAGNTNGHPAQWSELRELADKHGIPLIEDSTEAIGSTYKGAPVGTFGDCSIFDFSQPMAITCGEGGMVVTDDIDLAVVLRRRRSHRPQDRSSVVITATAPYQAAMSDLTASLGMSQLQRIDEILAKRKQVEAFYLAHVETFEGIKPPYIGPDITDVHWFLYVVHLGTRFSRSSRDAIIEDLKVEQVEASAYSSPLHLQRHYYNLGYRRGDYFVTEKVADRAIALPFHTHLDETQVEFLVETMKDASINVGAGAAIY